jgi:chorismate synthase
VPPRLALTEADIQPQMTRRRPGQSALTTPRDEADKVAIWSGTERGVCLLPFVESFRAGCHLS